MTHYYYHHDGPRLTTSTLLASFLFCNYAIQLHRNGATRSNIRETLDESVRKWLTVSNKAHQVELQWFCCMSCYHTETWTWYSWMDHIIIDPCWGIVNLSLASSGGNGNKQVLRIGSPAFFLFPTIDWERSRWSFITIQLCINPFHIISEKWLKERKIRYATKALLFLFSPGLQMTPLCLAMSKKKIV